MPWHPWPSLKNPASLHVCELFGFRFSFPIGVVTALVFTGICILCVTHVPSILSTLLSQTLPLTLHFHCVSFTPGIMALPMPFLLLCRYDMIERPDPIKPMSNPDTGSPIINRHRGSDVGTLGHLVLLTDDRTLTHSLPATEVTDDVNGLLPVGVRPPFSLLDLQG